MGYFYKMALADVYVILDHVQFKKRYFENRNKILTSTGKARWLSVPVLSKGKYLQAINEVEIDDSRSWRKKFLETIRHSYHQTSFFSSLFAKIEAILQGFDNPRLIDLNMAFIHMIRNELEITTPLVYSSEILNPPLETAPKASDLILELCLKVGASQYICGPFGCRYLTLDDFDRNGINIEWLTYDPPQYKQHVPGFMSHLSTLDALFNHGPAVRKLMVG
ncbi:WbqC-like protein family like protein [Aduncisulcus paluster]|uniref:WbqC-like protein family like protein n=1 Tax=Aduncisulcus paluster TaxID=2918883 RepID=A0ABQ5K770_9EUKA|nr:WbqC-like protein family like protein [Aduncisulcus paluster]